MGLASTIRSAVAVVDAVVNDLQDDITVYPWIGIGSYGEPSYDTPVTMKAIVEEKESHRPYLVGGEEVIQRATITIPRPVAANGAAERREPIDPRDKIVLPSGYTGPILNVEGITDPSTHNPYMYVILLG